MMHNGTSRLKVLAAAMGGAALVGMGIGSVAINDDVRSDTVVSDPGTFTAPEIPEMSTGATAVVTTTEATRAPEVATPPVTAEPPEAP